MFRFIRNAIMVVPLVACMATGAHAATLDAIEFYNAMLDHYFVTASADEIAKLDAGALVGWQRTGQHFTVFDPATPVAGASAVCRFYGSPDAGLDSHFYSASPAECAAVRQRFPGVWIDETDNAFGIWLPDTATGHCPSSSVPVYRAWNHRVDSNHRFTTDAATLQSMLARGYVAEGYGPGPLPVAMCAPGAGSGPSAVPVCVVTASNGAPYVGSSVTLSAQCTNAPTEFRWTGCVADGSTCTATSSGFGQMFYSVVASNAAGAGAPANASVIWQPLPAPPKCALSRTTQTDPPTAGGYVVLQSTCDASVGSYAWSGCTSTTSTCTKFETSPGTHSYSMIARNEGGTSEPATLTLNWVASAPTPPGFCAQFPSYLMSDVGSETMRVVSAFLPPPGPGFAWNGVWIVRFVVPPTMTTSALGRLSATEYGSGPIARETTISDEPCDFRAADRSGANGPYSVVTGSSTNWFSVNPARTDYPALARGGTYYFNVRNYQPSNNTISCPSSAGRCDAFVESFLPR
jgi:hypothetical protein